MNSIWFKVQWNINFPFAEVQYTVHETWESYYIYTCSEIDERFIITSLYNQAPSKYWIEDITNELQNMNVNHLQYPPFDKIDYCTRKRKGDSQVILLLNCSDNILYVYTCSR